jgi:hypothetical protein
MKVRAKETNEYITEGNNYEVIEVKNNHYTIIDDTGEACTLRNGRFEPIEESNHYDNTNGSLYKFAQDHKLNSWEFDVIKRIVRCRKKGQWLSDIDKTIKVLELYKEEYREVN